MIFRKRMRLMTTQQKDAPKACVCSWSREDAPLYHRRKTVVRSFVWRAFFCLRKRRRRRIESLLCPPLPSIVYLSAHKNSYPRSINRVLQTRYATALLSRRLCRADQTTTMEEDVDDDNDDALFLFFHRVWFATTKKRLGE